MVRPKHGQQTALTTEGIKARARQQMAEAGTSGLSLRAIARELGVTAPAIYNYYPRLDDLITALIVDAYGDLADALAAADQAQAGEKPGVRLLEILRAYRAWALAHPAEFSLIYGNPIPGYHAPEGLAESEAVRGFGVILQVIHEAQQQGRLPERLTPRDMPEGLRVALQLPPEVEAPFPPEVVYVGVMGWYHIHGLIMLELFHHTDSLVNDTGLFYEFEIKNLLARLGLL